MSQTLPKEERLCVTLRVRSKEPSAAEEALSMLQSGLVRRQCLSDRMAVGMGEGSVRGGAVRGGEARKGHGAGKGPLGCVGIREVPT